MPDVAIIGAGELGGDVAHVLARSDAAATIRLIEEKGQVAAGKALDIMHAASIEGFATVVSGSSDLVTAAGAPVIVLADRFGGPEWHGDDGLLLLKRLLQLGSGSVVLCAGASQRELVERGVREARYPRDGLFGSAPEALVAAARAIVALEANGSASGVALTVLGVPPSKLLIPWEEATIGGFLATSVLTEQARRRLATRVPALWPPGPYALAWAATKAVEAVFERTRRRIAAFVAPDDTAGQRTCAAILPVRLGRAGISRVELPSLNAHDRVALDNAMLL